MPYDFSNFHDGTDACYVAVSHVPSRTPDYVSPSGSEYWDRGDGVFRRSDHWTVGEGLYSSIRSCFWYLEGDYEPGDNPLRVGFCLYSEFKKHKKTRIYHTITALDRELALVLSKAKGAIPSSAWVSGTGRRTKSKSVPPWAWRAGKGFILQPSTPASKRLLRDTQTRIAITAEARTIRAIINGASKILPKSV